MVEVINKDPVGKTPPSQPHDFTAFVFGATNTGNTPNPVVSPPPPPLAATTDLNDQPRLENTYVNNRTTPSNYTQSPICPTYLPPQTVLGLCRTYIDHGWA
eukprot:9990395-Ditylum_brightwellii.AAC.1